MLYLDLHSLLVFVPPRAVEKDLLRGEQENVSIFVLAKFQLEFAFALRAYDVVVLVAETVYRLDELVAYCLVCAASCVRVALPMSAAKD